MSTSFSSIILGSGLVTATGNNIYINGASIFGQQPGPALDLIYGGLTSLYGGLNLASNSDIGLSSQSVTSAFVRSAITLYSRELRSTTYYDGTSPGGTSTIKSLDWENGRLFDRGNDGYYPTTSKKSLDWSARSAYDEIESLTFIWTRDDKRLISSDGYTAVNWGARSLINASGGNSLNWNSNSGVQIACPQGTGAFLPLTNNMFTVQVNETTNKLNFVVKYSTGGVKSGSMDLA